jgi:hypothetical protein
MADQADADDLARRYLDLWQDQMSALAADQDFARAIQQIMTGMGLAGTATPATFANWAAWPGMMAGLAPVPQGDATADAQSRKQARSGHGNHGAASAAASGAAAPGADTGGGGADLDQLTRRLAALEKRIAALEGGTAPGRRRAASKPRKAKS